MTNKLNGNLKWVVSLGSLILIIGGIVASHYVSLAQVKDSIEICIKKEIDENDDLDKEKFYSKESGTEIKTDVSNMKVDIVDIKASIKGIEKYQQDNRELLVEIKTIIKQQNSGG